MALRRLVPAPSVRLAILACLALAALSLLGPHQPTYDPWAWLVWGRDIAHGRLNTVGGPSWKPFPVIFTTPFSLVGSAAPALWLIVARAGFLLALVAAYRLATSAAGPIAGVLAVVGVAVVDRFASLVARGDSEGLLAAMALGAVDRHLAGHRRQALLLGLGASLVRPEVWPFVGLYVLWLLRERAARGELRVRTLTALAGAGAVIVAVWFVPEKLGSGNALRGASRALEAVEGSPAQAAHPFLAVFSNSASAVAIPLYAGAVLAVVVALERWRRRGIAGDSAEPTLLVLLLAAASCVYMVIVAALAQAGFTGNERYVLLPASVVCVVGAIGLVRGVRAAARHPGWRWTTLAVAVIGVLLLVSPARRLDSQLAGIQGETHLYDRLQGAIDHAGGRAALTRCGPIYSDPFQTQIVLWHLHLDGPAVSITPKPPGTIIAPVATPVGRDARFPVTVRWGGWVVRSTCR